MSACSAVGQFELEHFAACGHLYEKTATACTSAATVAAIAALALHLD
jgi:hypothetical protein